MSKQTILIDLTSLDDNFSGIEKYALNISDALIKNNLYDYVLLFKNRTPTHFLNAKYQSVKKEIIKGRRLNVLLFGRNKAIKKIKPDYAFFPAFPPSFLFSQKHTKNIVVIHDLVCFDVPKTMKFKSKYFFRLSITKAIKNNFLLLTDSNFSKNRIMDRFNIDDSLIRIVPCGCNFITENFNDKIKTKLPPKYVLSLSTIEPRKNIPFILKSIDRLWLEKKYDLDFVMVGRNGWEKEKLLDCVSNENTRKIHFTGFVDERELPCIYRKAAMFVFSSIYEGFGMPVLECIRYGSIPLCSNIPTNLEILGEDYPFIYLNQQDFIEKVMMINNLTEVERNKIIDSLNDKTKNLTWENSAFLFFKFLEEKTNNGK